MTISVTHSTVVTVPEGTSPVGTNEWNSAHVVTMAGNRILGRNTSGVGLAQELSSSQVLTFLGIGVNSGPVSVDSLNPPVLPNGSDMTAALQAAIDTYTAADGVTLQFGVGTYIFNSSIVLKPNVILRGVGIDITILKIGVDNTELITRWASAGSDTGVAGIESLTVWGFYDRNPVQNTSKLVNIGPFNYYWIRDVKAIYGNSIALSAIGGIGIVDSCVVNQCLRDGVNLTGTTHVLVTNNDISQVGDDAIACDLANSIVGVNDCSARIVGNRIEKSFGIKLHGIRNAVVSDNVLRFYTGYGIFVGIDTSFGEGLITKFGISITGNTLLDGLNVNNFDVQNIGYGIFLLGDMSLGTGGTAIAQNVGLYNSGGKFVQTPDAFINKAGAAQPRGPDGTISITSNNIRQTVSPPGMVNFSDAGFGELWYNTGPVDPAIDSLIGDVIGIGNHADCENIIIAHNTIHGTSTGIDITHQQNNAIISHNTIFRVGPGHGISLIAGAAPGNGSISVGHNLIDLDPYLESYLRTTPINGTWTVSDGSNWMGIWFDGYNGVTIMGNRFRNCIVAVKYVSGTFINERNILECDFINYKGIADPYSALSTANDLYWWVDSDPTSPTFNQHDADFNLADSNIPTSGTYTGGQIVRNDSPVIDANNMVIFGWIRLTDGSAHVPGVDWAVARVSNVSPAT